MIITIYEIISAMETLYFQENFAERIGGAKYGKGNEIYKLEKKPFLY